MARILIAQIFFVVAVSIRLVAAQQRPPAYPGEQGAVDAVLAADGEGNVDEDGRVSMVKLRGAKVTDAVVAALRGLQRLESVELIGAEITDASLATLATCPKLARIELAGTAITDAGIARLSVLKNLQYLDLSGTRVGDNGLAALGELPELRSLEVQGTRVGDDGLRHLARFPKLESIRIAKRLVESFSIRAQVDADQHVRLKATPNTRPQHGDSPVITDRGLAMLARCRQLKYLDLTGANVTDAGMHHLAQLTRLTMLHLDQAQITDAGIAQLTRLTRLTWLGLEGTGVTDDGLAHVAGMVKLETLDVQDTKVTNAGLKHLGRLTALEHVFAEGTRIDKSGHDELDTLLPRATVHYTFKPRAAQDDAADAERDSLLVKLSEGDLAAFLAGLDKYPDLIEWHLSSAGKGRTSHRFSSHTALRIAICNDDLKIATVLLDRGALTRKTIAFSRELLTGAKSPAMTALLIQHGAIVEPKEDRVNSALFHVANAEVADVLLQHGANVHRIGVRGRTALHEASCDGRLDVVKFLLDRGADPNAQHAYIEASSRSEDEPPRTLQGDTPLAEAVFLGRLEVVELLLDRGARCDVANEVWISMLRNAVAGGYPRLVRLLLDRGAKFDSENRAGGMLLHTAIHNRDIEILRMLLDAGASVRATTPVDVPGPRRNPFVETELDKRGWTALHLAAHAGHKEAARLLVERGADVNARSVSGWTPLECTDYVEPFYFELVQGTGQQMQDYSDGRRREWEQRSAARKAIRDLLLAHKASGEKVNR